MKRRIGVNLLLALLVLPVAAAGTAREGPPQGVRNAVIFVTTPRDELNDDGDCSLREAIEAANTDWAIDACPAGNGFDRIVLPSGTYVLTLAGADENHNQTGDLDILDDLAILSGGASTTLIDAGGIDRIFDVRQGSAVQISNLAVAHGVVHDDSGGGIRNVAGTLTLNSVILRDNRVMSVISLYEGGGGLYNGSTAGDRATATLNNCQVIDNTAFGGGGILNSGHSYLEATLTLSNTTVGGNVAVQGGGIWHRWFGPDLDPVSGGTPDAWAVTKLYNSTVSDNLANGTGSFRGSGGGMLVQDGEVTLVNTTISGNRAHGGVTRAFSGLGGGIAAVGDRAGLTMVLTNTTIAGNSATSAGGGIALGQLSQPAEVKMINTLVGDNQAPVGLGRSCFSHDWGHGLATFTSLGHNLEDRDQCGFDQPGDWVYTDPLLGPLADNGGQTCTHCLLEGSLARDHADDDACPPCDQCGGGRPQGAACDIGAFEACPDENPPQVVSVHPPDGVKGVGLGTPLVIAFSEPIDVPTLAFEVTPDPGGWAQSWDANHMTVTLRHYSFAPGTTYVATLTGAEDRAGNALDAPFAWSFTTLALDHEQDPYVPGGPRRVP